MTRLMTRAVRSLQLLGFVFSLVLVNGALTPVPAQAQAASAQMCALPGKDPAPAVGTVVNNYYQAVAGSLTSGATSLTLGARDGRGADAALAVNDLLLIIQMQDASIATSDNANYGGSGGGAGTTSIGNTGRYEFVKVTAISGSAVTFAPALTHSYTQSAATASQGQRSYQIVRVPQYSSATVAGVEAPAWNGAVGGVVAIDASGVLTLGSGTVEGQANTAIFAAGRGFRGAAAVQGSNNGNNTQWVNNINANGGKGEGIAGTPLKMVQFAAGDFSSTTVGSNLTDWPDGSGYPVGNRARGAPGNAGGGGSDGSGGGVQQNSGGGGGGGGGGNAAAGGLGGRPWSAATVDASGRGGAGYSNVLNFNRIFMGGGGGAGGTNDRTGDTATYAGSNGRGCGPSISSSNNVGGGSAEAMRCASGAAGGGIVILRAKQFAGSGVIDVRGAHGYNVRNDAGGGGGAGGSVVLHAQEGAANGINIYAQGGDGGNAWAGRTTASLADRHGGGGGGGGGFVVYSPATMAVNANLSGGVPGKTSNGADTYGADGYAGGSKGFGVPNVPGIVPGAICGPDLQLRKSNNSSQLIAGGSTRYDLTVSNEGGVASVGNIRVVDVLPAGLSVADGALTLSGPQAANWSCSAAANVISCDSSTVLEANAQSVFGLTVNVVGASGSSAVNKARVGGGGDPDQPVPTATTTAACTANDKPAGCALDTDVIDAPLLTLSKTDSREAVTVGGVTSYSLTVSNTGSSDTAGPITVVDVLPAGISFSGTTPFSQQDFSCSVANSVVTCVRPASAPLAAGATAVISFAATVGAAATAPSVNLARVGGGGDPSKPTAPTETTVRECAAIASGANSSDAATGCASDSNAVKQVALELKKDDGLVTMPTSGQLQYSFTVLNTSDTDSIGEIGFRDVLPASTPANGYVWPAALTVGGSHGANWSCTRVNDKEVTCLSSAVIPAGGSSTFTLIANTSGLAANVQLTNKARIGGGGDPQLPSTTPSSTETTVCNNSAPAGCSTDTNTATNGARLRLAKSHPNPQAKAVGDSIAFALVITNTGSAAISGDPATAANNIRVVDVLPAGLQFSSATATTGQAFNCSHAAQVVTCAKSGNWSLASNASTTITINATVTAAVAAPVINRAQVGGGDSPAADVTATTASQCSASASPFVGCAVDPVPLLADLSISKQQRLASGGSFQSAPLSVLQGETVQFSLTVSSAANAVTTQAVAFSDVLPAGYSGVSVLSATVSAGAQGCSATVSGNSVSGVITSLPAGGVCTVILQATASKLGSLSNSATVSVPSGIDDPTPTNNTSTVVTEVNTPAFLVLSKALTGESGSQSGVAEAGETLTYTITVENSGGQQGSIDVVDILSEGLTFISATPNGSNAGRETNWTDVQVPGNSSVALTVTAQVDSPIKTASINNLVKTLGENDPACPSAQCVITPTANADLAVTKTVDESTPKVGDNVVFTITASNNGASDASNVVVTEQLPSGYTFVSSVPSIGTYDNATGLWTIGALANGDSATLNITATVLASGDYANTATITGGEHDPTPSNNTSTNTPTPEASADLDVDKTVDNPAPKVGEDVVFTITATNNGASDATNVEVTEQLPSGYTLVSNTASAGTYDPATGLWTIGSLANGDSATLNITATVLATGDYANTATITGGEHDPTPSNNTSTNTPTPEASADLDVDKTVDNSAPKVGEDVVFTITATNNGASDASNVVVTEQLPSGYTLVSNTASAGTYDPATGLWTIGSLANGASATLDITATVLATGDYANTATITGGEHDPTPGNNTSTSTPTPEASADLEVDKAVDNSAPKVGEDVVFTITATNNGASDATNVEVTEQLPSGYTLVSNTASAGTYDPATGLWTIGALANGDSATLNITATVLATGDYANTATITGGEHDPTPGNNTSTNTPTPGNNPIVANNDTPPPVNGKTGGSTPTPVTDNDTLGGDPVDPNDIETTVVTPAAPIDPTNPNVPTLDTGTGIVTVPPNTPAGDYEIEYKICELINPANCNTAIVTVTVTPAPIDAVDDPFGPVNGKVGGTTDSVLDNDTLGGQPVVPAEIELKPGTSPHPGLTMNPDGTITVAPETPAGSYRYPYEICELLNPSNCDPAVATVVVEQAPIVANPDTPPPVDGKTGGSTPTPVTDNDTLGGDPVDPNDIETSVVTPADPIDPSNPNVPTLDTGTGIVTVPPNTPAGDYEIEYKICELINPANCSTAIVTVTVTPAPIDAVDDPFGPVNGKVGGTTDSVLDNDTLDNQPVVPAEIELKPGTSPHPGLTMNPDGTITVAPETPAGSYSYPYEICELLNPSNCDPAVATVVVEQAPIVAENDPFAPVSGKVGGTTDSVLDNDTLDGKPVDLAEIDLQPGASPNTGLTMNPDGTVTVAPNTPAGSYSYPYQICEKLNPSNCADAIATVVVTAAVILASNDDQTSVYISVAGGKSDIANILDNDSLNGVAIDINDITIEVISSSHPGLTVDPATGLITVAPNTPAGDYTLTYTICETLNPTNCDSATVLVKVEGGSMMSLTKRVDKTEVATGDLVRYTIEAKNTSPQAIIDAVLVDTPPAGFTLVADSLAVKDRDGNWRLAGQSPIRVEALSVDAGEIIEVSYLLRVGPGAAARGEYKNTAQMQLNGKWISNVATASVTRSSDPLFEDTRILGTVFDDIDGDGWQDSAKATGMTVQGGFAPADYVANSTLVDRGEGFKPEPDASSPLLHGIKLGTLEGRASEVEPIGKRRMVITQQLKRAAFNDDFVLETAEGHRYQMDRAGRVTVSKSGDAKAGLTAQDLRIERMVSAADKGLVRVDYVITNHGLSERGIPGVRLGTVEGLLITTDAKGRYHLEGLNVEHIGRGQNFIVKVDASTLPKGTVFTTKNPLLKRITQGIPVRFDFGVQLPKQALKKANVALELGEVLFAPDSAELKPEYSKAIAAMAAEINREGGGLVEITGYGDQHALALERAEKLQRALAAEVKAAYLPQLEFSLKGAQRTGGLDAERVVLADVLFDTDSHHIKAQHNAVIDTLVGIVKQRLADNNGVQQIVITGHTDRRASPEYNYQLGLKRAQAVYDAVSQRLSVEERARLRVTALEVGQ